MRPFEIVLLVLVGLTLLKPFSGSLRRIVQTNLFILVGWVVVAVHLLFEGARWQMIPIYALLTLFTIQWQIRRIRAVKEKKNSIWLGILGLLILSIVVLPLMVFPIPNLIEPSGPSPVGTISLYFQDATREEIYSSDPKDVRELNVQIWYPSEIPVDGERAPYMDHLHLSAPAFARFLNLPAFVLNHISLIDTHAFIEAPVAKDEAPYPVLIFSHGWGGTRTQSTYLMEELASRGYVVVAIDHTYGALVTVFPDDRVVLQKVDILGDDLNQDAFQHSANTLISVWAGDVRFILDQLESMNDGDIESLFADRLDLDRVGVFGHSTGGGNAVQVCWMDQRCKVGLTLDAWLEPLSVDALDEGLDQPFMFLWSEGWGSEENVLRFEKLSSNLRGDFYNAEILGTRHYDFSDLPLLSPLSPWLGLKGPIDGQRVLRIIDDYVAAYFDRYLLGIESPLLEGPSSEYPEVEFQVKISK
jgi:pimeloyl-ACP methyl ester carboxylesterase